LHKTGQVDLGQKLAAGETFEALYSMMVENQFDEFSNEVSTLIDNLGLSEQLLAAVNELASIAQTNPEHQKYMRCLYRVVVKHDKNDAIARDKLIDLYREELKITYDQGKIIDMLRIQGIDASQLQKIIMTSKDAGKVDELVSKFSECDARYGVCPYLQAIDNLIRRFEQSDVDWSIVDKLYDALITASEPEQRKELMAKRDRARHKN
jgi:hypothetical protein